MKSLTSLSSSSSGCCFFLLSELTTWLFVTVLVSASLSAAPSQAAPFSSWAGKRSGGGGFEGPAHQPDLAQLLHDLQELYMLQGGSPNDLEYLHPAAASAEKRAPFSSWAGKRAPFSSWAGKRAPFSSWAGKRAPFSSWAGKRSGANGQLSGAFLDDEDLAAVEAADMEAKHRIKRSSVEDEAAAAEAAILDEDSLEEHARQRRGANQFSAWGGKRNSNNNNQLRRFTRNAAPNLVSVKVMRPQRAAFSAWGG